MSTATSPLAAPKKRRAQPEAHTEPKNVATFNATVAGRSMRIIPFNSKVGARFFSNFYPMEGSEGSEGYLVETQYQCALLKDERSRDLFARVMADAAKMNQPDFAAMLARLKNQKKAPSAKSLEYWTFERDGVKKAMVAILAKMMANILKIGATKSARTRFNLVIMETLKVDMTSMQRGEEKTDAEKKGIMIEAMLPKYRGTKLGELLLATNDAYLMEFGRGSVPTSLWTAKVDKVTRSVVGRNLCGECLMEVRERLRQVEAVDLTTTADDDADVLY